MVFGIQIKRLKKINISNLILQPEPLWRLSTVKFVEQSALFNLKSLGWN